MELEFKSLDMITNILNRIGNLKIENIRLEDYNIDYEGFIFDLESRSYRSRLAN